MFCGYKIILYLCNIDDMNMRNVIRDIENEYRSRKGYGIQFSIDGDDAYNCRLGDRVTFGNNQSDLQLGTFCNWQDILLDGEYIGYLRESQSGRLFDPMVESFRIPLADCTEHELWVEMSEKYRDNPHLNDAGEVLELRFATLNQMLDFLDKT